MSEHKRRAAVAVRGALEPEPPGPRLRAIELRAIGQRAPLADARGVRTIEIIGWVLVLDVGDGTKGRRLEVKLQAGAPPAAVADGLEQLTDALRSPPPCLN